MMTSQSISTNSSLSNMTNDVGEENKWFVMRDLQRKFVVNKEGSLKGKTKVSAWEKAKIDGYNVFVPMKFVIDSRIKGRKRRKLVPVIRDLVFIHGKYSEVESLHNSGIGLTFRFYKGGKGKPMEVPELEMERFIRTVESAASVKYYTPDEVTKLKIGSKIRIIGGPFDGLEGELLTVQRSSKKRLLVGIKGTIFASIIVEPDYIEYI